MRMVGGRRDIVGSPRVVKGCRGRRACYWDRGGHDLDGKEKRG